MWNCLTICFNFLSMFSSERLFKNFGWSLEILALVKISFSEASYTNCLYSFSKILNNFWKYFFLFMSEIWTCMSISKKIFTVSNASCKLILYRFATNSVCTIFSFSSLALFISSYFSISQRTRTTAGYFILNIVNGSSLSICFVSPHVFIFEVHFACLSNTLFRFWYLKFKGFTISLLFIKRLQSLLWDFNHFSDFKKTSITSLIKKILLEEISNCINCFDNFGSFYHACKVWYR